MHVINLVQICFCKLLNYISFSYVHFVIHKLHKILDFDYIFRNHQFFILRLFHAFVTCNMPKKENLKRSKIRIVPKDIIYMFKVTQSPHSLSVFKEFIKKRIYRFVNKNIFIVYCECVSLIAMSLIESKCISLFQIFFSRQILSRSIFVRI